MIFLFPSPYGVSFILIDKPRKNIENLIEVSVSLRSIIHSYVILSFSNGVNIVIRFPSPYGVSFILINMFLNKTCKELEKFVSVSLRSIIHSYFNKNSLLDCTIEELSFRLLTEYHSFLYKIFLKKVLTFY